MELILFTPFTYEGSNLRAFMKISPAEMRDVERLVPGAFDASVAEEHDIEIVFDEVGGSAWVIGRLANGEFVVLCDADDEIEEPKDIESMGFFEKAAHKLTHGVN